MSGVIRKSGRSEVPFVQYPRVIAQDASIKANAKVVLLYLLSLPPGFEVKRATLHNSFAEGRDWIRDGFDALIKLGYITKSNVLDKGKFAGVDYEVHHQPVSPQPEIPAPVTPDADTPAPVDPSSLIRDTRIKDKEIKNTTTTGENADACGGGEKDPDWVKEEKIRQEERTTPSKKLSWEQATEAIKTNEECQRITHNTIVAYKANLWTFETLLADFISYNKGTFGKLSDWASEAKARRNFLNWLPIHLSNHPTPTLAKPHATEPQIQYNQFTGKR